MGIEVCGPWHSITCCTGGDRSLGKTVSREWETSQDNLVIIRVCLTNCLDDYIYKSDCIFMASVHLLNPGSGLQTDCIEHVKGTYI